MPQEMKMELLISPVAAPLAIAAKPTSVERRWTLVTERLPQDGKLVQVILEGSREIRVACRGHYQSTSAWFDAATHTPIYETIARWKARS
jgi:hypothetical protein